MAAPTLKELLKSVESELWIRSLDDVVCVHAKKSEKQAIYSIYLKNGVEVEVYCDEHGCGVGFVGRRLTIANLEELEEALEGLAHVLGEVE